MKWQGNGSLGEASITERAKTESAWLHGLTPRQREVWDDVQAYMLANDCKESRAIKMTGVANQTYYAAKKKAIASHQEAFKDFRKTDFIRDGDAIVAAARWQAQELEQDDAPIMPPLPKKREPVAEPVAEPVTEPSPVVYPSRVTAVLEESVYNKAPPEVAAVWRLWEALAPFDMETRRRVMAAAAQLLGVKPYASEQ